MRRIITTGVLILAASIATAQDSRLQPDFTFKRVRPPSAQHSGPRITVQITPPAPAPLAAPADGTSSDATSQGDWFWSTVPTGRQENPAQRLQTALRLMQSAPQASQVPAPRLQQLQTIAQQHGTALLAASIDAGISPALGLAVISVESAGKVDAQSSVGAQGLMQLIPATAERFGVADPLDPTQNITGGMAYLSWLVNEFDGDIILALAGYNAGEGAVRENNGVPNYPETRAYIPKVLAAWQVARGLCQTPPQLMTDGCVFIRAK